MKYHLKQEEAVLIEQTKSMKDDPARPVLGLLRMMFKGTFTDPSPKGDREFGTIQIAKTDSYRLLVWHLDVLTDGEAGGDRFWDDEGMTLFPKGQELIDAVKILREQAKAFPENVEAITLEPWKDTREESSTFNQSFITVSGVWKDAIEINVQATPDKIGQFPNIEPLVKESMDAGERNEQRSLIVDGVTTHLPMVEGEPPRFVAVLPEPVKITLPALKPEYLADIPKLLGSTVTQRKRFGPAMMTHNVGESEFSGFELKPPVFCVLSDNKANRLTYVLMPVRV